METTSHPHSQKHTAVKFEHIKANSGSRRLISLVRAIKSRSLIPLVRAIELGRTTRVQGRISNHTGVRTRVEGR
jgi:hypothetical protein